MFAMMFGAQAAGQAAQFGPDTAKAASAAENVYKIIDEPSEIDAVAISKDTLKHKPTNVKGLIEFKDVWFRYPTRKTEWVLRGLNLTVQPQEKVALVGESGCGKSTFVALLMRFYDPDFGEILVDGVNIKDYNLHELRKVLGLVMQEPVLFNYNIRENILYGKTNARNTEIFKAAEISNSLEFITNTSSIE